MTFASSQRRLELLSLHLSKNRISKFQMKNFSSTDSSLSTSSPPTVHLKKNQSIRNIVLDKPTALNSLDLNMIYNITPQLLAWQESDLCKVIVVSNLKESKAFCAGGDVKKVVLGIKSQDPKNIAEQLQFFEQEYKLNHLIATTKKPYISILNGITMGGGVGLSVHGHFRIATENTLIAMPETSIGLFPDVGGSFFLPRLDGELGTFLGLTGHRLKAEEAYIAGFATHYIPSNHLDQLTARLAELESDELSVVNGCIDEYSEVISTDKFLNWSLGGEVGSFIDRAFKFNTIEEILLAVETETKSPNEMVATFAKKQLSILRSVSPTSLKVTLEQLRRGAKMHLSDCFKMEYRMVRQFLSTPDFIEGVSAKLLEKREPVWTPSLTDMSLITPAVVDLKFFEKKVNMKDLELYNRISYYDYPHRTLSGLPTDKDVQRVLMGEGRRHVTSLHPHTKREVKEWIGQNWGRYDSGIVGDSNSSQLPTRLALDGGYGRGKVGLMEKVEAILERHTKETENGLKWIN